MTILFEKFFRKPTHEFYHLAGQSHVGLSFEIPGNHNSRKLPSPRSSFWRFVEIKNCLQKSILPVPRRSSAMPLTRLKMKILQLIQPLLMALQKHSVCTLAESTESLTICLFAVVSSTTMNPLAVEKILSLKRLFVKQHRLLGVNLKCLNLEISKSREIGDMPQIMF